MIRKKLFILILLSTRFNDARTQNDAKALKISWGR